MNLSQICESINFINFFLVFSQKKISQKLDEMDEMEVIREENLFDLVDDSIIVEIATWLITSDGSPDWMSVTYLLRFSETCKRMFGIISRSPHCNLIWRFIDIGEIINEMAGIDEGSLEKKRTNVNRMKSQPWIASCVKLSMMWEISNTQNLGLIMSMPNLMDLEVELHESEQFMLTTEKKVIEMKQRGEKSIENDQWNRCAEVDRIAEESRETPHRCMEW